MITLICTILLNHLPHQVIIRKKSLRELWRHDPRKSLQLADYEYDAQLTRQKYQKFHEQGDKFHASNTNNFQNCNNFQNFPNEHQFQNHRNNQNYDFNPNFNNFVYEPHLRQNNF